MNKVILNIPRSRKKVRIVRAKEEVYKELLEIERHKRIEEQIRKEESHRRLSELKKLESVKSSRDSEFFADFYVRREEERKRRILNQKTIFTEKFVITKSNQPIEIRLEDLPEEKIPLSELKTELQNAYDNGFNDGQEAAGNVYKAEIDLHLHYIRKIDRLAKSLKKEFDNQVKQLEGSIVDISVMIAEHIINSEIIKDDNVVIQQVKKAMKSLEDEEIFKILVNEDDYDLLQRTKTKLTTDSSKLSGVVVTTDSSIERGMCILHTAAGIIDARLTSQLDAVKKALYEEEKSNSLDFEKAAAEDAYFEEADEYDPQNELHFEGDDDIEDAEPEESSD